MRLLQLVHITQSFNFDRLLADLLYGVLLILYTFNLFGFMNFKVWQNFKIICYLILNMSSLQKVNFPTDKFCFSHAMQVDLTLVSWFSTNLFLFHAPSYPCIPPSPVSNFWSWLTYSCAPSHSKGFVLQIVLQTNTLNKLFYGRIFNTAGSLM